MGVLPVGPPEMASRPQVGLRSPRPGDAGAVPRVVRDGPWHRCVDQRHQQPWWFSTRTGTDDPGRFDLQSPAGTCYLAASQVAAILEVCADPDAADPPPPTTRLIAALLVWSGRLHEGSGLADTTVASTPRLTVELSTVVPYDLPHEWADALAGDGAAGLIYTARFGSDAALALFGREGPPDPDVPDDPRNAGVLTPTPAADYAADLPLAMRPVPALNAGEYDRAPPPA